MNKYTIANSIAECRKKAGLSQTDAARLMGLEYPNAISKYENGIYRPSLKYAIQLADIYGVTLDELIGREVKRDA